MEQIKQVVNKVVLEVFDIDLQVQLSRTDDRFGDCSTNAAMQLAGRLQSSPIDIARQICDNISSEYISKSEVAGPGFINITLTDEFVWQLATQSDYQLKTKFSDKRVVIETNNPNPFKAMHIGHAFNAILADTLANLIQRGGAKVHRVSYHGDVGLHVGKSMYSLLRFIEGDPSKLDQINRADRNDFISKMYAEGSRAYEQDESAKAEIDKLAKESFTRNDPLYAAVYDKAKAWSFEQLDADVSRLGNKPVEQRFLESSADARGVEIVKDFSPAVFKKSEGAYVFEGSKHGSFDNVFVSSQGTGLYAARDLGLMQLKEEGYQPDFSYVVTAEEQRDYFKGVIAAAELCRPQYKGVTINIPHGTVKLPTGKMSSRNGDVVNISWLFDEVSKAVIARGGRPDDSSVAAVLRYQFLQVRIGGDVVFDINEAVSVTGNSGPYLQYAYARACSITRKASDYKRPETPSYSLQPGERALLRKLVEYREIVEKSIDELLPHYICNYLYELAQSFNRFYEANRVIGDPRQDERLTLVDLYAEVVKDGLNLLGIDAPDQM